MKFKVEEYQELEDILEKERCVTVETQRENDQKAVTLQQKLIEMNSARVEIPKFNSTNKFQASELKDENDRLKNYVARYEKQMCALTDELTSLK